MKLSKRQREAILTRKWGTEDDEKNPIDNIAKKLSERGLTHVSDSDLFPEDHYRLTEAGEVVRNLLREMDKYLVQGAEVHGEDGTVYYGGYENTIVPFCAFCLGAETGSDAGDVDHEKKCPYRKRPRVK